MKKKKLFAKNHRNSHTNANFKGQNHRIEFDGVGCAECPADLADYMAATHPKNYKTRSFSGDEVKGGMSSDVARAEGKSGKGVRSAGAVKKEKAEAQKRTAEVKKTTKKTKKKKSSAPAKKKKKSSKKKTETDNS